MVGLGLHYTNHFMMVLLVFIQWPSRVNVPGSIQSGDSLVVGSHPFKYNRDTWKIVYCYAQSLVIYSGATRGCYMEELHGRQGRTRKSHTRIIRPLAAPTQGNRERVTRHMFGHNGLSFRWSSRTQLPHRCLYPVSHRDCTYVQYAHFRASNHRYNTSLSGTARTLGIKWHVVASYSIISATKPDCCSPAYRTDEPILQRAAQLSNKEHLRWRNSIKRLKYRLPLPKSSCVRIPG